MTNDNYSEMSNAELLDEINVLKIYPGKLLIYLSNHNRQLLEEIIKRTDFLGVDENIHARIYCIEHDVFERPTCSGLIDGNKCQSPTRWDRKAKCFKRFCCGKCAQNDVDVRLKRMKTNLKKYGCGCVFQSKEVKITIQKKMEQKTTQERAIIRGKKKSTCEKLYGGVGFASKSISQKIEESNLMKFGVVNASSSPEIRQKIKNSCLNNFGVDNPMKSKNIVEKQKERCNERYGVDNVFQSKKIKERIVETNNLRYGVDNPMMLNEIKNKVKNTMMEKYGVEFPLQNPDIKGKMIETNIRLYGVENYTQTIEYHKNKKHKYHSEKYPELTFDSTWEVKVYEFCRNNSIPIEYSPEISYPYEYDKIIWTYHPDFLINGRVYEVKGDNFFRINESTGLEEMFNPYRESYWSDERYEWECGKYEAKHQCMLKNNVHILRKNDIVNLSMKTFE